MIMLRILYFVLGVLVGVMISPAFAHDWYDPWCCSGNDCAKAEVQWLPDGRIKATTKHGSAIFGLETKLRISKDGNWHACIPPWATTNEAKARCLYAPAGM